MPSARRKLATSEPLLVDHSPVSAGPARLRGFCKHGESTGTASVCMYTRTRAGTGPSCAVTGPNQPAVAPPARMAQKTSHWLGSGRASKTYSRGYGRHPVAANGIAGMVYCKGHRLSTGCTEWFPAGPIQGREGR